MTRIRRSSDYYTVRDKASRFSRLLHEKIIVKFPNVDRYGHHFSSGAVQADKHCFPYVTATMHDSPRRFSVYMSNVKIDMMLNNVDGILWDNFIDELVELGKNPPADAVLVDVYKTASGGYTDFPTVVALSEAYAID
jgi:hypothetical protein